MSVAVSVLMTVYNADRFLPQAIESVLAQTHTNFEFIIINDGSTDNSMEIIKSYQDDRIKLISRGNKGFVASLNEGVQKSSGKYIARMDADDLSDTTRIKKQFKFLENNPEIAMVGSSFNLIDEASRVIDKSYHLDRSQDLQAEMFVRNPFGHGTVMIRRSVLQEVNYYAKDEPIEDYDLWWRVARKHKVANLPELLYSWRVVPGGMSHGRQRQREKQINRLAKQIWSADKPPAISHRQVFDGLEHYKKLGQKYHEQYKFMLAAICLGALRMGRPFYGLRLACRLISANQGFVSVLRQLNSSPRSHNYNLSNLYQ